MGSTNKCCHILNVLSRFLFIFQNLFIVSNKQHILGCYNITFSLNELLNDWTPKSARRPMRYSSFSTNPTGSHRSCHEWIAWSCGPSSAQRRESTNRCERQRRTGPCERRRKGARRRARHSPSTVSPEPSWRSVRGGWGWPAPPPPADRSRSKSPQWVFPWCFCLFVCLFLFVVTMILICRWCRRRCCLSMFDVRCDTRVVFEVWRNNHRNGRSKMRKKRRKKNSNKKVDIFLAKLISLTATNNQLLQYRGKSINFLRADWCKIYLISIFHVI